MQWSELKSDHFIVYFSAQNEDFAAEVLDQAEEYYHSVAEDLGYVRYSNFWKWENRVKVFIYPDHGMYLKATGKPAWSHGMADYKEKFIASYVWGEGFMDTLLVHEIAHLIFRDFIGFKRNLPLWLDEGVAQWEERSARPVRKAMVRQLAQDKLLFSLYNMMELNVRNIESTDTVYVHSVDTEAGRKKSIQVSGKTLVDIYYLESFSLIGFLMEQYGAESFIVFCRQLRDGKDIDAALRHAYPQQVRSIDDLEKKWTKYLNKD